MAARKHVRRKEEEEAQGPIEAPEYDFRTPLWERYYRRVRASVRFPRYYKKALNW